jgi:hypothetical protein
MKRVKTHESYNGTLVHIEGGGIYINAFYTLVDRRDHYDLVCREGLIGFRIVWEDTTLQQEQA